MQQGEEDESERETCINLYQLLGLVLISARKSPETDKPAVRLPANLRLLGAYKVTWRR